MVDCLNFQAARSDGNFSGRDSGTSSTAIVVTKAIGTSNQSSTGTKSEPSNSSYPSSDNETGEKYVNIFFVIPL